MRCDNRSKMRIGAEKLFDVAAHRFQVEHHAHAFDNLLQRPRLADVNRQQQGVTIRVELHRQFASLAIEHNRSGIGIGGDMLDTGNRAYRQITQHRALVERWPVTQANRNATRNFL